MERVPTPIQVATRLHQIAKSLEDSSNPDPNRVAAALQEVVSRIAVEGFIDAETLMQTMEKALKAGKLNPDQEKGVKDALEAMKKEEKKTATVAPTQVATALRTIASRIDASKSPDPKLVARDIGRVLKSLGG